MIEEQGLITAQELADYLAVPVTWVWLQTRERRIPCIRCGRYQRFILADVIAALQEDIKTKPEGVALPSGAIGDHHVREQA